MAREIQDITLGKLACLSLFVQKPTQLSQKHPKTHQKVRRIKSRHQLDPENEVGSIWFPKPCHGGPRLTKSTLFRYKDEFLRGSLIKGMIICSGISSTHHQLTTVRLSMSRTAFLNILREWEAICMCVWVCVCVCVSKI